MPQNPVKFVKVHNIKTGISQVVPLATYEQLSTQSPKTMKNLEFLYNCDEDGNRIEGPKIEILKPVIEVVMAAKTELTPKEPVVDTATNKKPKIDKIAG